ncbi:MAG: PIN domain-containing protein [Isosphaeraceae bacterium]
MTSIDDAVTILVGNPRPVLALDTCVLLDVLRAGMREQTDVIAQSWRLSEIVINDPNLVQLVMTSLVVLEWEQNKDQVRQEMRNWLAETDKRLIEIHKTWDRVGKPKLTPAPTYLEQPLIDALTLLGESLIQIAIILDEDNDCVMRALDRVKQKRRPSHRNEIKDSIHLEHYQELARRLNAAGFAQPVIFVSTNKADFWADTNTPEYPHVDLRADMKAVDMLFYGRLAYALRHLHVIPGNPPPPLP